MLIRKYQPGEEMKLYEIFYSSIHENANTSYSQQQRDAWAPEKIDEEQWKKRIGGINPYVIIDHDEILGYADIQHNGYIDHFFVKGGNARKGIGTRLLARILEEARTNGIKELTADVSVSAQPFFLRQGFKIVKKKR